VIEMKREEDELCVVTEIGVFADLNISDPTKKKLQKADSGLEAVIEQAIKDNEKNLIK
jgi:hypothetical protein